MHGLVSFSPALAACLRSMQNTEVYTITAELCSNWREVEQAVVAAPLAPLQYRRYTLA